MCINTRLKPCKHIRQEDARRTARFYYVKFLLSLLERKHTLVAATLPSSNAINDTLLASLCMDPVTTTPGRATSFALVRTHHGELRACGVVAMSGLAEVPKIGGHCKLLCSCISRWERGSGLNW
jgi:hypothetical protein